MNNKKRGRCIVSGCHNLARSHSLCGGHANRLKVKGSTLPHIPLRTAAKRGAPRQWIDDHLHYDGDECLIWPFWRDRKGYGRLAGEGWEKPLAHRLMCRLAHGDPPSPFHEAAHSCGNGFGGCVTPNHLRWATRAENEQDKLLHNSILRGEDNPRSRFTTDDIVSMRKMYQSGEFSLRAVARHFGTDHKNVSSILKGRTWAHVPIT
jgi:hypothetical protein